jgi:RNA polymerase sigma factor (sigma-70 family)
MVKVARARLQRPVEGAETFSEFPLSDEPCVQRLRVDEALTKLPEGSARQVHVVEMRFFAGMKDEEIAAELGVSVRSVRRDLALAGALLSTELEE